MVHPDIRKHLTSDLYISPLEFDPGRPPSDVMELELAKGESRPLVGGTLTFADFDLGVEGNALAQMESGGLVTLGAVLDFERDGEVQRLVPLYRFDPSGRVQTVARSLPGGGLIGVAGINASQGAVRLTVAGIGGQDQGEPAKLSIDVTEKPLINLVWWGFMIILAGGLLAISSRIQQVRKEAAAIPEQPAPSSDP
jgi:cytochrome c-type biogenesis protein CcmF